MNDIRMVLAITKKDFLQEWRSKAATVATLFFSATTLVLIAFALGRDGALLRSAASGVLWIALAFAGVISAAQSFQADLEEGAFDQLLLYPVPRALIYVGKLLANWAYLAVLGLLLAPVAFMFYDAQIAANGWLMPIIIVLGSLGFAIVATFYAALTANLQAREALLPVLMFPIVVPILLASVRATEVLLLDGEIGLATGWLQMLGGFDLVYLVGCTALFHFVVEE